jgi:hypothetical protein
MLGGAKNVSIFPYLWVDHGSGNGCRDIKVSHILSNNANLHVTLSYENLITIAQSPLKENTQTYERGTQL